MSAFLVSHATVDVILTQLELRDGEQLARLFAPFTAPEDPRDALDNLGRQILALNVEALRSCYPGHDHSQEEREAAAYVHRSRPETAGYALKQLDCLTYQLAEGNVPSRPLFDALDEAFRVISARVVNAVPAYTAAPWGVR